MESLLNLTVAGGAPVRILQITDTHLFAEKHETLLGVNTWESYQAVLSAIHAENRPCDLIVATGDLAQDQSSAAYQHFAEGIASFSVPCVWLPGNHDFQPAMYSSLQDAGISPAKCVFVGDHWQILLLDSQVFGVPHGELSDFQLDWLETKLSAEPERHTLLLLHHHPLPAGCSWLDQHSPRWTECWRNSRGCRISCADIFIRNRISTGMAADCWPRPRPAFSSSRIAQTLPWTPSHRAGAGSNCIPMACSPRKSAV